MRAEADLLAELKRLRIRVPQLTGALAASSEGLVLAADTEEAESVASLTAAALRAALRLTEATGQGASASCWSRASGDTSRRMRRVPRPSSPSWPSRVPTSAGFHLEARRSGARIGELVDGALDRPENT